MSGAYILTKSICLYSYCQILLLIDNHTFQINQMKLECTSIRIFDNNDTTRLLVSVSAEKLTVHGSIP